MSGDRSERISLILDYLCGLDNFTLRRFCKIQGVVLGIAMDAALDDGRSSTKRQVLKTWLKQADDSVIRELYRSARDHFY